MKRTIVTLLLLASSMSLPLLSVAAQDTSAATPKKHAKKSVKKATKKIHAAAPADEDEAEPDIAGSESIDFNCELGNKITVYENANDNKHIAIRWHKRLSRLTRVDTTTGANRFENHAQGLVWIGIPAKSMLLDAKHGHQLANECRSVEQQKSQQANAHRAQDGDGAPLTAKK